jgi:hypothetical protein
MTPAESVGLPETCEHSIPVTQRGLRVGGNMLLAHGAHNREEHTAIRRGGGIGLARLQLLWVSQRGSRCSSR